MLLGCIVALHCFSQYGRSHFRHPQFARLDKSKGMGSNAPVDITIDKDYKYWIASYNGLIEYDGSRFNTYHIPSVMGSQLGSDVMYDIGFRNDSLLWITHVYGIATFNIYSKQYTPLEIRAKDVNIKTPYVFRSLFTDKKGNTFFFSRQTGALKYDPESNSVQEYLPLQLDGPDMIYNIVEMKDGFYLLLTREGLLLFDPVRQQLVDRQLCPEQYKWLNLPQLKGFTNAYEEIDGVHFVSVLNEYGEGRIIKYDPRTGTTKELSKGVGRLFFKDSFNHLWLFGFGNQADVYDPGSDSVYHVPDKRYNGGEIDFSVCYSVFEDHEQNIWLCTNNGLLTYNLYQNGYLDLSEKIPGNTFASVVQIAPDRLWCGTPDKGIYEYRPSSGRFIHYPLADLSRQPAFREVGMIFKQPGKNLVWIAHPTGKITRYDLKSGKFEFISDTVMAGDDLTLAGDASALYASGGSGRVYVFDEQTNGFRLLVDLNRVDGINRPISINTSLSIGNDEMLFGTTETGMLRYHLKTGRHRFFEVDLNDRNSISSNLVIILKQFTKDRVFGGTINGIFSYDIKSGKIENFNFNDNFSLSYVTQFGMNRAGNLVIVCANGLYLLDWKTKNIIDLARRSNIDKLHLTDVLYSEENNRTFLTSETAFYELLVNSAPYSPRFKPVVHYISTVDRTFFIRNSEGIVLNKSQNSFQVHFGASTFRHKEDLEFFYKLDDGSWLPASSGVISFSKLAGGTYFFRLKAVYKGNRAISYDTGFTITIKKAFYEQAWFYLLLLVVVAGIVYLFYRLRVKRLLAVEKVRFQLSRDLHDDMGSTLSTINILSSIALDKVEREPALTRTYLQKIAGNSQQMMESMDDIVWSINPANDNLQRVIYRMREFASGILEPKNIRLDFQVGEGLSELSLSMHLRRDFFLIFKEAVNNAAKYAQCHTVFVSLTLTGNELELRVIDDGTGFDVNAAEAGNGLVNMRKRASLIGADISILSEPGKGTTILLKIKLK